MTAGPDLIQGGHLMQEAGGPSLGGTGQDRAAARRRLGDRLDRRRPAPAAGRWHGRILGLLKIVLPLTALALLAAVLVWPSLRPSAEPEAVDTIGGAQGETRLVNPRYYAVDGKDQPYSVAGAEARQTAAAPQSVLLDKAEAEIMLDDGSWLALRADGATYDRDANAAVLTGHVSLFRDDGYAFYTDTATVDVAGRRAWGDGPVEVHGPEASLTAGGFRIDQKGGTVAFTGPARLVLRKAGAPAGPSPGTPTPAAAASLPSAETATAEPAASGAAPNS